MSKKKPEKTDISALGEFGLIRHLTDGIKSVRKTTYYGVGDDAAVIDAVQQMVLVTTDLLLEGIHFNLVYTPLKHLGYKAVVVNLSDIYAMNGMPEQITVSLGISSKFSVENLDELYGGIKRACENYQVDLVGGDTSSSLTGLNISITAIGQAKKEDIVFRNGASEHDLICVSGTLGGAYMGLQLLERERQLFEGNAHVRRSLEGHEYIMSRQLKPEARGDIITGFLKHGFKPTAMIDLSDGLSSDLLHITRSSGLGCRVHTGKIPVSDPTREMAAEFHLDPLIAALSGGEDYELLFTVATGDLEKVHAMDDISIIGHMVKAEEGEMLIGPDGSTVKIEAQGWQHLA